MGIKEDYMNKWRQKSGFEKALSLLGDVLLVCAVALIFLQLFNVWEYGVSTAVILLTIELIVKGIASFRTERAISFVYFGGACGMIVIYFWEFMKNVF